MKLIFRRISLSCWLASVPRMEALFVASSSTWRNGRKGEYTRWLLIVWFLISGSSALSLGHYSAIWSFGWGQCSSHLRLLGLFQRLKHPPWVTVSDFLQYDGLWIGEYKDHKCRFLPFCAECCGFARKARQSKPIAPKLDQELSLGLRHARPSFGGWSANSVFGNPFGCL